MITAHKMFEPPPFQKRRGFVCASGQMFSSIFQCTNPARGATKDKKSPYRLRIFQSTHPLRVRHSASLFLSTIAEFQSTPPREAIGRLIGADKRQSISIHASRKGRDDASGNGAMAV